MLAVICLMIAPLLLLLKNDLLIKIYDFKKMTLRVKLDQGAKAPFKASAGAAGYDLYANEEGVIPKNFRSLVSTGVYLEIPEGCYGRIAPRSSLACKHCVDVGAGVVDNDYRGELKVLLINNGEGDFIIKKGDRIAQLIFENYSSPTIQVVGALNDTARGAGGFGSTGK